MLMLKDKRFFVSPSVQSTNETASRSSFWRRFRRPTSLKWMSCRPRSEARRGSAPRECNVTWKNQTHRVVIANMQCEATTHAGKRCTRAVVRGGKYCAQHFHMYDPVRGRSRSRSKSPSPSPSPKLKPSRSRSKSHRPKLWDYDEHGLRHLNPGSYYLRKFDPIGDVCRIRDGDPTLYRLRYKTGDRSPSWVKCTKNCRLSCQTLFP